MASHPDLAKVLQAPLCQPVDLGKIRSNLTLTSLIAQDSAELAHCCGIDLAIKHRQDEEKAAKAMWAESLRMQTDQEKPSLWLDFFVTNARR